MRVSVIVDGGFLKARHRFFHQGQFPSAEEVWSICARRIMEEPQFANDLLFRIFFYDCQPFMGEVQDPRLGESIDFGSTPSARAQSDFLHELAKRPHVAMRLGELAYRGLRIPDSRIMVQDGMVSVDAQFLEYDFKQKQVDIKMGLDIAWLAQKRIVDKLVLVAGDSDLIPAMKFARTEGLLAYLVRLGQSVKFEMLEHSDDDIQLYI